MDEVGKQAAQLAEMLCAHRPAVVLTGAGISTESGIPDFRSPGNGLWTKYDPEELLSVRALKRNPQRFYREAFPLLDIFSGAQPNPAHFALAELQRRGLVSSIITQNIDNLHQAAGAQDVIEVHGHLRTGSCVRCGRQVEFAVLRQRVKEGEIPPTCDACGGMLRPDVVLYGDAMPAAFALAERAVDCAGMLLVVGSSLQVSPVNGLVFYSRVPVAIINVGPTAYDRYARLVINAKASVVLQKVLAYVQTK